MCFRAWLVSFVEAKNFPRELAYTLCRILRKLITKLYYSNIKMLLYVPRQRVLFPRLR